MNNIIFVRSNSSHLNQQRQELIASIGWKIVSVLLPSEEIICYNPVSWSKCKTSHIVPVCFTGPSGVFHVQTVLNHFCIMCVCLRLILEFELRTKEESGLVLYMARINHADFVTIQVSTHCFIPLPFVPMCNALGKHRLLLCILKQSHSFI